MTSLRWLPGRSLAGHIVTRPATELRKMNDRMLRDIGLRRDQVDTAFGSRDVAVTR
jgi:hypothetical protein